MLKITKNTKINSIELVNNLTPKTPERAKCAYNILKQKYGHIFNKIEILRTNNIKFSEIEKRGTIYDESTFTLYLNDPEIYILRRTNRRGYTAKLLDKITTFQEILTRFDHLLNRKGYEVN